MERRHAGLGDERHPVGRLAADVEDDRRSGCAPRTRCGGRAGSGGSNRPRRGRPVAWSGSVTASAPASAWAIPNSIVTCLSLSRTRAVAAGSSSESRRNGSTPNVWYASDHGPIVLPMTATSSPKRWRRSLMASMHAAHVGVVEQVVGDRRCRRPTRRSARASAPSASCPSAPTASCSRAPTTPG